MANTTEFPAPSNTRSHKELKVLLFFTLYMAVFQPKNLQRDSMSYLSELSLHERRLSNRGYASHIQNTENKGEKNVVVQ
jgi:hypothetical protein